MVCFRMQGVNMRQMSTDEDDLEGEDIGEQEEEPKTDYLSPDMKEVAAQFPKVLKDTLLGAKGFTNQPHKEIDINPSVDQCTTLMSG